MTNTVQKIHSMYIFTDCLKHGKKLTKRARRVLREHNSLFTLSESLLYDQDRAEALIASIERENNLGDDFYLALFENMKESCSCLSNYDVTNKRQLKKLQRSEDYADLNSSGCLYSALEKTFAQYGLDNVYKEYTAVEWNISDIADDVILRNVIHALKNAADHKKRKMPQQI